MLQMFLTEMELLSVAGPLSVETTQCIRTSFAEVDFASVMTDAYARVDSQYLETVALVGSIAGLSCLNEWESLVAEAGLKIGADRYEIFQCAGEKLGGPEGMAPLMRADAPPTIVAYDAMNTCFVESTR